MLPNHPKCHIQFVFKKIQNDIVKTLRALKPASPTKLRNLEKLANLQLLKQDEPNMIHFQTYCENKYVLRSLRRRPQGAGVLFQNLLGNKPYLAHPMFKMAIRLVFQNFIVQQWTQVTSCQLPLAGIFFVCYSLGLIPASGKMFTLLDSGSL